MGIRGSKTLVLFELRKTYMVRSLHVRLFQSFRGKGLQNIRRIAGGFTCLLAGLGPWLEKSKRK